MSYEISRELVIEILKHPLANGREWTYQGLGMLRLYLTSRFRLHVWSPSRGVTKVSTLHTHPWDFQSHVIIGSVRNFCYRTCTPVEEGAKPFSKQCIKCGTGGGLVGEPEDCSLTSVSSMVYDAGQLYFERAETIHRSKPDEGTVTIVDRSFRPDTEHAFVFWRRGESWVSAEPRPATDQEVLDFCNLALETARYDH